MDTDISTEYVLIYKYRKFRARLLLAKILNGKQVYVNLYNQMINPSYYYYYFIRVISFIRKTKVLNYQYRLGNFDMLRRNCIKVLGVHIGYKLNFHYHVDITFHMQWNYQG
jgi:hypothetical protein